MLPRSFGLAYGLTYLFGPLLYFYIRSDKNKIYYSGKHLVPFGLFVLSFLLLNYFLGIRSILLNNVGAIAQNLQLIFYIILIYRQVRGTKTGTVKRWKTQLLIAYSGYVVSFATYYLMVLAGVLKVEYDYTISLAAACFIYFVGYRGFSNPEILNEYDHERYRNSSISAAAAKSVLKKLKNYFDQEKPYRNSKLRLGEVAAALGLSSHQISQVLNEHGAITFSEFVNKYRYEEAKLLLVKEPQTRIMDIGFDCGFNNKTSFNNVFKKYGGMSPSEFRKTQSPLSTHI
ncbi:MAG: helix-turn-helix domain-containing protein [Bacteroidota bacterium]